MSRYDGKPFLRFLDCYVLSSIGHLDENKENTLSLLTPELSRVLGFKGSWFDIVAAQMEFSSDLPVRILKIWEAGQARAKEHGVSVDPEEFARQFVDKNFSVQ